ncbi:hypothetical protein LOTGIDRAFT_158291 [Lottia gigantea]|uniref:Farnesoic acid O-methyl transferase domain-containing protein n=1 Tax=Lottia gigantea TaxID=225164 RepID=V4A7W4_LOTGI|nr:hypothetical protein LOTGIDRAFT_158291 [Lottia gigantea]ESP00059.1 hypothetical protein LOTGIDRAFT_158291 [Lottia gigantea]
MPQNRYRTFTEFHNVQYQNSKMIWIKGDYDGVIGLFNGTRPNNFMYEIVIGGGGNTWTGAKSKTRFKTKTYDNNFMLEPKRFKPFWLTWSEASLDIVFGVGNQIGNGKIMRFKRDPTFTLKYLALYDGFVPVSYILELQCSNENIP